jgi:hypothetical protein
LTKEFIDPIETWSSNHYNPYTDEIHILQGNMLEYRALIHERAHAQRKNKATFKLAQTVNIPVVTYLFIGALAILAASSLYFGVVPLLAFGAFYLFLLCCGGWEEYKANEITNYETNLLKSCQGGEKQ